MPEYPPLRPINNIRTGPRGAPPVVLIHPVGLDLSYWGAQVEALCDDHDVVVYDLPGHGRTPGTPQDWTLDRAAAVLHQVVRATGAETAHVVGLSVGGMIAQALALAEPTRLCSLTLIDTAAAFTDEARDGMRARADTARMGGMAAVIQSTIARWFTPATVRRRPDIIDRVTKTLLADDPAIHAAMWEMIASLDLVAQLPRIACPTLIMVGELDPSSPPSSAEILQAGIAQSEMMVIPGVSHMAPLEAPRAVNERLAAFLAQVSP